MPSPNPLEGDGGLAVWFEKSYSHEVSIDVSILVSAAAISLIAATTMLLTIVISSFTRNRGFIRSHLGAYFVSLIVAEIIQAVGSLMSIRWVLLHKVQAGTFCAVQSALKNAGNVSTSLWTMVIAFHTFSLVFLKARAPSWAVYTTLVSVWLIVGFIVILGPAALQRPEKGPFWGVNGYWCWITGNYVAEQFCMEYLFLVMEAIVSFLLYVLIFLRLRGNIEGVGFRIVFCRARTPWQSTPAMSDPQIERVGRRMLLYPICSVILVLPIAACRWRQTYSGHVPFQATIFADTVFVLSGLVNAVLYSTTRRVAPVRAILSRGSSRRSKRGLPPATSPPPDDAYRFQSGYPYPHATPVSPPVAHIPPDDESGYVTVSLEGGLPSDSHSTTTTTAHRDSGFDAAHVRFHPLRDSMTTSNSPYTISDAGYPGPEVRPAVRDGNVPSFLSYAGELEPRIGRSGRSNSSTSDAPSGLTWVYERSWA